MSKRLVVIGAILVGVVALGAAAAFGSADRSTAGVNWHPQQASLGSEGPVDDASATLTRNANGVSYRLQTNSLTPDNAYTLWVVVINNPAACDPTPCTAPDILQNPATDSQVLFGTGLVAGGSGKATFAGALKEGDLSGWLEDRSFDDATTAEIHLVLNDHGPKIPALLPDMIKTYRGGCSDESPFPGIFPATALADGAVGPNTCRLSQSAIFAPEDTGPAFEAEWMPEYDVDTAALVYTPPTAAFHVGEYVDFDPDMPAWMQSEYELDTSIVTYSQAFPRPGHYLGVSGDLVSDR